MFWLTDIFIKVGYYLIDMLEKEHRDRIVDWKAKNEKFTAEELQIMLDQEFNDFFSVDTVRKFLEKEETKKRIESVSELMDKRAEYTKQDLKAELVRVKEKISKQVDELYSEGRSRSSNEATSNLLDSIKLLGDAIDALGNEKKVSNNYINVKEANSFVNNNVKVFVKNLPDDVKRELVEDLSDELGIRVYEEVEGGE